MGGRDFTPDAVSALGAPGIIVHGLRVKPGKPTVLASADGKPVIGLPGNPASALVILQAVAAPIVTAVGGRKAAPAKRAAKLAVSYEKRAGWTWYVPAQLLEEGSEAIAHPLPLRSSSVSLLARASGFIQLGASTVSLAAGEQVEVTSFL